MDGCTVVDDLIAIVLTLVHFGLIAHTLFLCRFQSKKLGWGGEGRWLVGGILVSVRIPLVSASVSAEIGVPVLAPTISLKPVVKISPNLDEYTIGTSLRADSILLTLT